MSFNHRGVPKLLTPNRVRGLAHDYARRAKACLNGTSASEYGRALVTLPDFILEREN